MKKPVHDWLQRQWYRIGLWHLLLVPISGVFLALVMLRQFFYRVGIFKSFQLPVPVIVIGNISVGGTGKTPLVIWLVRRLQQAGYRPGIISRGYGQSQHNIQEVRANAAAAMVGDEPLLMAKQLNVPVFVGRDRVAVAKQLVAAYPDCDVLVSDDGLQHYRLQRDIEIAVIDGVRGFGNGLLIPAGPLRELPSRLQHVDFLVASGAERAACWVMHLSGKVFHGISSERQVGAEHFASKKLHAVAGIGYPQKFFSHLQALGLVFTAHEFPDHYAYQAHDFDFAENDIVLMTEKDAVKCIPFAKDHWWYLPVDAELDEELFLRITKKLGK